MQRRPRWTAPAQGIPVGEQRCIAAQRRQVLEQQSRLPLIVQHALGKRLDRAVTFNSCAAVAGPMPAIPAQRRRLSSTPAVRPGTRCTGASKSGSKKNGIERRSRPLELSVTRWGTDRQRPPLMKSSMSPTLHTKLTAGMATAILSYAGLRLKMGRNRPTTASLLGPGWGCTRDCCRSGARRRALLCSARRFSAPVRRARHRSRSTARQRGPRGPPARRQEDSCLHGRPG
jgi:hypothetical protein